MGAVFTCVMIVVVIFTIVSTIIFNKVKENWVDIIGVGGAYMSSTGILGMIWGIVLFVNSIIDGNPDFMTFLIYIVISALFLIPFIRAELRCESVKQRILLPLVCLVLTCGFVLRLFFNIFLAFVSRED